MKTLELLLLTMVVDIRMHIIQENLKFLLGLMKQLLMIKVKDLNLMENYLILKNVLMDLVIVF